MTRDPEKLMNDDQFFERAHADPHDQSPEFLDAAAQTPERRQLLDELKRLDADLHQGLESVVAPTDLKQSLLAIPGVHGGASGEQAANDSLFRRLAPLAASLVLAVGLVAVLYSSQSNVMENMVFDHLYSELEFLDREGDISVTEVNAIMAAWIGGEFRQTEDTEALEITMTKDCFIDFENGVQGMHLVIKGDRGPVTVMVIPNTPLDAEMAISDDRFDGVISPTDGGNIVVLGEKEEPIHRYSTLLAGNMSW